MSHVLKLLKGSKGAKLTEKRDPKNDIGGANIVGEGPVRKLYKGEFEMSCVRISLPSKPSNTIDLAMMGDNMVEIHLKSARIARSLLILFKTQEEGMLFLYYLSNACKQHNVPEVIASSGMSDLYNECERIVSAAKAHNNNNWSDDESDGSADARQTQFDTPPGNRKHDQISHPTALERGLLDNKKPIEAVSSDMGDLSSPPPKQSSQPHRKAPAPSTPARRVQSSGSVNTDDAESVTNFEDDLFFSIWDSNRDSFKEPDSIHGVINKLHTYICEENSLSAITRPFWWRLCLGILYPEGRDTWADELKASVTLYEDLRRSILPVMAEADTDPLSSPNISDRNTDGEWRKYYKVREKVNFIQLDINRLYLNDIDESYFEDHDRRVTLLNILVLWSLQHENTAYRQGMHELVGILYYVVEAEAEAWLSLPISGDCKHDKRAGGGNTGAWLENGLRHCFQREHIEAYVYWLFDRLMVDLECLFDPNPAPDGQPPVLHYCFALQENLLSQIDYDLCSHMEAQEISCQLYGMRWSRLLLSREFGSIDQHVLPIWDFLLVNVAKSRSNGKNNDKTSPESINEEEIKTVEAGSKLSPRPEKGEAKGNIFMSKGSSAEKLETKNLSGSSSRGTDIATTHPTLRACVLECNSSGAFGEGENFSWVDIPDDNILSPLQFIMASMLVFIRDAMLESDNNNMMALLMRYPETADVWRILDLAHKMMKGLVRFESQARRARKRDIVFKNLQKIGKFGSRMVTQTIRRGSALSAGAAAVIQSTPSTPQQPITSLTTDSAIAPTRIAHALSSENVEEESNNFEMEMNVAMNGLFSPPSTLTQETSTESKGDVALCGNISALLIQEGESLASAVALISAHDIRQKYYDGEEESSSDDGMSGEVVRKKFVPLPPPEIQKGLIANRLRRLADVLDGGITIEDFNNEKSSQLERDAKRGDLDDTEELQIALEE